VIHGRPELSIAMNVALGRGTPDIGTFDALAQPFREFAKCSSERVAAMQGEQLPPNRSQEALPHFSSDYSFGCRRS